MIAACKQVWVILKAWSTGKLSLRDAQIDLLSLLERRRLDVDELVSAWTHKWSLFADDLADTDGDASLDDGRRRLWRMIAREARLEIERRDAGDALMSLFDIPESED